MRNVRMDEIQGVWRHHDFNGDFYIDFAIRNENNSIYTVIRSGDDKVLSQIENILSLEEGENDSVILFDKYRYPVFHLADNGLAMTLEYENCRRTFKRIM